MPDQDPDPADAAWATTSAPTLLRLDHPDGRVLRYRAYDPALTAGRDLTLTAAGKTESPHDVRIGFAVVGLLVASAVAAPLLFSDGGLWSTLLWAGAGLGASFVAIVVVAAIVVRDPFDAYRKRFGSTASPFVEVEADDGSRAGALCAVVEAITTTAAWRDQAIDPDRLVGGTLWSAVRLAERIAAGQDRLARDEASGVSASVLEPSRQELSAWRSDLDHVERNLREIARIAREIDAGSGGPGGTVATAPSTPATDPSVAGSDAMLAQSQALRDLM